jgi:RNA polymerase-binding transcription factor DksA
VEEGSRITVRPAPDDHQELAMRAAITGSAASNLEPTSRLSAHQTDLLQSLLLTETRKQAVVLAKWEATLVGGDTAALDRAMAALRMYRAREALEQLEDALSRVEEGTYGTCQACDRPIPLEYLVTIPQARFCATCASSAVFPAAEGSSGPRLGPGRGERAGIPPPVRLPRPFDRPNLRSNGERL